MHSHQNHMDKMQIQKTIHLFELAVLDDYYEEQGPWLLSSRTVQVASRTGRSRRLLWRTRAVVTIIENCPSRFENYREHHKNRCKHGTMRRHQTFNRFTNVIKEKRLWTSSSVISAKASRLPSQSKSSRTRISCTTLRDQSILPCFAHDSPSSIRHVPLGIPRFVVKDDMFFTSEKSFSSRRTFA